MAWLAVCTEIDNLNYTVTIILEPYLDNCPPRKIAPRLGLGLGSRLGLVLGLGVSQTIDPKENSPPPVMVSVWVRVGFRVGGQFSSGQLS